GMPDSPLRADNVGHEGRVRITMVARFDEPKDHGLLIRALACLGDLDWVLDLVGDGPLVAATSSLVASLGLSHRVNFLGHQKDVAPLLASSQVFALTSRSEGLPRSILEAMR